MTTLESLKNLSVALDCGEPTADNIADAIQFMADNYPQPVINLFNRDTSVNGILNVETGELFSPVENVDTSDYISLEAGTYKITSTKNDAQSVYYDWYVCSYDSDNTFIERVGMTRVDDTSYTFTISEAIKFRFTYSSLLTDIVLKSEVE